MRTSPWGGATLSSSGHANNTLRRGPFTRGTDCADALACGVGDAILLTHLLVNVLLQADLLVPGFRDPRLALPSSLLHGTDAPFQGAQASCRGVPRSHRDERANAQANDGDQGT
eukprot:CAMPEP_0113824096 /NCGR_PEP_ID=MMETSP0328-20130328/3072_1 /TAXON_ID=39455 /ORGANISM="Alexandrium minutum" /LENGTH=113 /DNA_ID=CAMNT_0000792037 /DNA_START=53 /DNA_END=394 /DNA_ORIENTATION=+ /assembly_acc=CAM_ASM_000350